MDQLKNQLAVAWKHSFWIMVGTILLVTLVSWWMSTGSLAAHQKAQKDDITTKFTAMEGLQKSNPQHPNKAVSAEMDKLTTQYAWEVFKGWDLQYQRQSAVLVWPPSFRGDTEFMAAVEKYRPIENVPINDKGQVPFDKD